VLITKYISVRRLLIPIHRIRQPHGQRRHIPDDPEHDETVQNLAGQVGVDRGVAKMGARLPYRRAWKMLPCADTTVARCASWTGRAGHELRQPLGIAIVGGLLVSQALTLYTTPVAYVLIDRLRRRPSRSVGAVRDRVI
jgi:hypothetical protein